MDSPKNTRPIHLVTPSAVRVALKEAARDAHNKIIDATDCKVGTVENYNAMRDELVDAICAVYVKYADPTPRTDG